MPAISVSSVNTSTEELTATAHGLTTGDRFRLRNVGGALPAATPSLAGATDYFALVTGVNTLKVCPTNADALAGTNIVNLTGSGSGTTTIEYGLPYCIPTVIAAPGTQVKSADLNGSWNSLVALYDALTGQAQSVFTGVALLGDLSVSGGQFVFNSAIAPATIVASVDINDWAPTGLSTAATIRQAISNSGVGFNITGLTGGVAGRRLVIHMLGTGGNITLKHENAGSAAANRFSFASGSDLAVPQLQGCVQLEYDGTSSRWRCIGKNF